VLVGLVIQEHKGNSWKLWRMYLLLRIENSNCLTTVVFYVHGSVHRESNLLTVQRDATYSVYYVSVGSSTCFGCWHPSSGAGTAVITASGVD